MRFGYAIVYVPSVTDSMRFFVEAFGFTQRFLHEGGDYGELNTGETTLAFASHDLGGANLPEGYVRASDSQLPLGFEIVLVADDVDAAFSAALASGAVAVALPAKKPWGQVVAYVRAPDGVLVELCSPIAA